MDLSACKKFSPQDWALNPLSANQLTGFYMRATLAFDGLIDHLRYLASSKYGPAMTWIYTKGKFLDLYFT